MYDLIVIGAGPGGYQAAVHASQMGKTVALVEKDELGGTCLNTGCIPAKALLWSSRLYRQCTEAKLFGIEVGPARLDLRAVVERKDRIVAAQKSGVGGLLRRCGVEVLAGHARLFARNLVSVGGELLEAANVLVATGSQPLIPPIVGIGAEHVLTSSSVFELAEVPSRVAIVGGGYIGLELATFFAEIGAEVAVFEVLPRVASGCDQDVSEKLLAALKSSGVAFNLSSEVLAVEENGVRYRDASGEAKTFEADCIVNATGRAPMVTGFGLEELGVDFTAKGVAVDNQGKTNVPGIWACGDVTGHHMLAHAATRGGDRGGQLYVRQARSGAVWLPTCRHLHPPGGRRRGPPRAAIAGGGCGVQQGHGAHGRRRALHDREREGHRLCEGPCRRPLWRDPGRARHGRLLQ